MSDATLHQHGREASLVRTQFLRSLASSVGIVVILGLVRGWVFRWTGGTLPIAPEALNDLGPAASWVYKFLYQGPIPYAIIGTTLAAMLYIRSLVRSGLVVGPKPCDGDLDLLRKRIDAAKGQVVDSLRPFRHEDFSAGSPVPLRLAALDKVYALSKSRQATLEANDRLTAFDEARLAFRLQFLIYSEWVLPILGFIGTVWGVTEAVDGLKGGIIQVFDQGDLSQAALGQFLDGFKGLVLAFDTTLFGLVGLAAVGTAHFLMRKAGVHVILGLDDVCRQAVEHLDEELPRLLRKGLFALDERGRVVEDRDGQPKLRWQRTLDELRAGLFETDAEWQLAVGEDGKPVQRAEQWRQLILAGLFATDENNLVLRDEDKKPRLRAQGWMDQLLKAVSAGTDAVHHLTIAWIRELYEVTEEEAEAIAEGKIQGHRESVLLRSRPERRFRTIAAELHLLTALIYELGNRMALAAPGGPRPVDISPGSAAVPPTGELALEPNSRPVVALATDDHRFAVVREEAHGLDEYLLHSGTLEPRLQGRLRVPRSGPVLQMPEEVSGLSMVGSRLAYACEESASIEARDWDPDNFPTIHTVKDGELLGRSLVLMFRDGGEQALFVGDTGEGPQLMAWRTDGSAPEPETLAELEGLPATVSTRDGIGLASLSVRNGSAHLHIVRRQEPPRALKLAEAASALALGAEDELWLLLAGGRLARLDIDSGKPSLDIRPENSDISGHDLLAVTAAGQAVLAASQSRNLVILDLEAGAHLGYIEYSRPITALAASPTGESLLLGCEDGSVHFLDVRRKIGSFEGNRRVS